MVKRSVTGILLSVFVGGWHYLYFHDGYCCIGERGTPECQSGKCAHLCGA